MSPSQIKLFGQTIYSQFPIQTHSNSSVSDDDHDKKKQFSSIEDDHNSSSVSNEVTKKPEESELTKESNISNPIENPKTPSIGTEPDLENDQSENNSKNTPTKPDKLIPCPRCDSLDTKFCYFNNYNLTQPRYFCKKCQRYWTSGGSMRNLAVGSGRRKNKNAFSSHCGQTVFSESIQASQAYGKLLDFGSNTPRNHCEPFTLKPNFVEKPLYNFQNQFHEPQRKEFSSDRSSINSSDSVDNGGRTNHVIQESFNPHSQNFSPIMFYQAPAHWGCFPYIYPPNCGPQILGKHSRENAMLPSPGENNLWFPKTLRIEDTSESTKSSIWSALGIKNEKNDCGIKKVVSKAFESNEIYVRDNSLVLQANPAAFARSLNFRENA